MFSGQHLHLTPRGQYVADALGLVALVVAVIAVTILFKALGAS